jgi:hypothetical protein
MERGGYRRNHTSELHFDRKFRSIDTKVVIIILPQKDFPKRSSSNKFYCVLKIGFTPDFSVTHKGMLVNLWK